MKAYSKRSIPRRIKITDPATAIQAIYGVSPDYIYQQMKRQGTLTEDGNLTHGFKDQRMHDAILGLGVLKYRFRDYNIKNKIDVMINQISSVLSTGKINFNAYEDAWVDLLRYTDVMLGTEPEERQQTISNRRGTSLYFD